jgi:hypothetical protein
MTTRSEQDSSWSKLSKAHAIVYNAFGHPGVWESFAFSARWIFEARLAHSLSASSVTCICLFVERHRPCLAHLANSAFADASAPVPLA